MAFFIEFGKKKEVLLYKKISIFMKNIAQNCQLMIKIVFGILKNTNNIKSLRNSPKKVNIGPFLGKLGLISA